MTLALLAQATSGPPLSPSAPATAEPIVVTAPVSLDIAPLGDAVAACDRGSMARFAKAEPHRRASFAVHAYDEQRAIAVDRARLAPIATTPVGKAQLEAARATVDARQKRLDDARLTEQAWRGAVEELRADFLANCGKHD